MHHAILPMIVATVLLSGCGMTDSQVRQQIVESEARGAAAQAQLEDRMLGRFNRVDQQFAAESERNRRDLEAQGEAQRRLVVDALSRQRDALIAQVRAMDDAIAALSMTRPLASGARPLP